MSLNKGWSSHYQNTKLRKHFSKRQYQRKALFSFFDSFEGLLNDKKPGWKN